MPDLEDHELIEAEVKRGPEGEELENLVKELIPQICKFLGLLEEDLRIIGYLNDIKKTMEEIYSGPFVEHPRRFATLGPKEFMQLQAVNNSTCPDMVRKALGFVEQLKHAEELFGELK